MNSLEVVQLARSKAAHELTVEEVLQIREAVASAPELCHLLGGEEEFARYMAEAPDVTGLSVEESAAGESADEDAQDSPRGGSRRLLRTAVILIALVIAVAGVWKFLGSPGPDSPEGKAADAEANSSAARMSPETSHRPSPQSPPEATADQAPPAGALGTEGNGNLQPLPRAYPLFEDEGRFVAVVEGGAGEELLAPLTDEDSYSGRSSVRVVAGKRYRLELNRSLPIRANPGEGEYRQLRFAFRKFGSGRLCLELEVSDSEASPIRYDAGQGPPCRAGAQRVWALGLPGEWIVMTCDVFRDFGPAEVTALTLSVPDGDHALFDHVYLERTIEGLDEMAGAPSVEITNQEARRVLAREPLSIAGPAVVRLDANGRRATGVLIGRQGHVLTCAHHLLAMQGDITVRLADGRTVTGRTAGICRSADCGVIRLLEDAGRPGLEFSGKEAHTPQDLHVGFSFTPRFEDSNKAASYLAETEPDGDRKMLWTEFEMEGAELGGPLVDRAGRVVGIHIRTSEEGMMGFAKLSEVRAEWERLARGESVGRWLPGSGPMIGVVSTAIAEGSRIDRVIPDSPAARAGLQVGDLIVQANGHPVRSYLDIGRELSGFDPGDGVSILIHRDGKPHAKELKLMHRQDFSPP